MDARIKTILYLMPVPWNWIAQRPHYIALGLGKKYNITVVCPKPWIHNWPEQRKTPLPEHYIEIPQIPFQERSELLRNISRKIFQRYVRNMDQYNAIWAGHPFFSRMIPENYKGVVLYDVMDDFLAMQKSRAIKTHSVKDHARLLERADYIFVTSNYLKKSIPQQYQKKTKLLRNGYQKERESTYAIRAAVQKKSYHIGYVGTVAEWIDFKLLLKSLDRFPDIKYHFWGPETTHVPNHNRLQMHGVIEHNEIYNAISEMDCMIIPFIPSPVIYAVDPVKMYEYINYGKCIISVRYEEIERFASFVWLYDRECNYFFLLEKLCTEGFPAKYMESQRNAFLMDNTWDRRTQEASAMLNSF